SSHRPPAGLLRNNANKTSHSRSACEIASPRSAHIRVIHHTYPLRPLLSPVHCLDGNRMTDSSPQTITLPLPAIEGMTIAFQGVNY
ncbi:hypothetical protein, partial [Acinetobacter baumannii]|uniref:hypothetical protein n=1 Tax=Acinetobacter baumannii TaxID=470 RepID=UPI0028993C1B